MSSAKSNFTKAGFLLLKDQFSRREIELMSNEYIKLAELAQGVLTYAYSHNMTLSEFYKSNQNRLIVVPEATNRLEICRFEYVSACSKAIGNSIIPKVKAVVDDLLEEPFVLFKDKCNVKNPGGGEFPPHQDIAAYQYFKPRYFVTAAIILDEANKENGPLEMALDYKKMRTGLHNTVVCRFGTFPFFEYYEGGKNNGDIKSNIASQFGWVILRANVADIVLFDSFVPHKSRRNLSRNRRRMFFFTFSPETDGSLYEEYYATKRNDFNSPKFHVSTPTYHE